MKTMHQFKLYKTIATLMLFSFSTQVIFAQNGKSFTEYKGIIEDEQSGDELLFADINILGTNINTITNNEGEFLIKIPNALESPKLKISHLGFKDKVISLKEFIALQKPIIKLEPEVTELTTVNIHTIKNAEALVKAMLSRKGNNYSTNQNIMTAFYRETIKKRRRNASLSEAVVDIYKQPYNSLKTDRVDLIKARKSVDYSRLDTLAVKLLGGPYSTIYTDLVKYQEFIFTEADLEDYNFNFETSSKVNNRDVYVVNFKQKKTIDYPMYYGKLFIDSESFALVSATYNLNVRNRTKASQMFVKRKPSRVDVYPTKAAYRVDYRIKDDLWYYGYSNVALTFRVKWKQKLFSSIYTLNSEMAVTDWKQNTTAKRPENPIRPTIILSEEASGFSDPEFWGQYNIIEPEKSIEKAISKISKRLKKTS